MYTANKDLTRNETSLDGVAEMANATGTQAGGLDPDLSQNGYGQTPAPVLPEAAVGALAPPRAPEVGGCGGGGARGAAAHAAFSAFQAVVHHQKLNAMKMLLLAVLGHGGQAKVLLAMMAAVVVAVAKAQAWHLQLLQRRPLQHMERHPLCRRECGRFRVCASLPREQPSAVWVIALLARCMRLQQVVDLAWLLVAEFLVVLELECLLLVSEEPNLAVRHFLFWAVLTVEQLVTVNPCVWRTTDLWSSTTWVGK